MGEIDINLLLLPQRCVTQNVFLISLQRARDQNSAALNYSKIRIPSDLILFAFLSTIIILNSHRQLIKSPTHYLVVSIKSLLSLQRHGILVIFSSISLHAGVTIEIQVFV